MKTISLCIFDMDGLLIDTEKGMWHKNQAIALKEFGKVADFELMRSCMSLPSEKHIKKMIDRYGPDFDGKKWMERVVQLNRQDMQSANIKLMPGTLTLLNFLKDNNIDMVVGTSTPKEDARKLLENLGILSFFKEVNSGADLKRGKPFPDIFLKCLGDKDKDEALVFEDSHNGGKAAINAGIKLVLVPDLIEPNEEEKEKAFSIIKSLDEIIPVIKEINGIK